jgi:hypothetical protein
MHILDEELELIADLAYSASMDCDCAISNLEDHETARGVLQGHSEKCLALVEKINTERTKRLEAKKNVKTRKGV